MKKNILVIDASGKELGLTYPKRSRGLIKKGRAMPVNEHTICLSVSCPPGKQEDNEMTHTLFFKPREWRFNPECSNNVGERTFITGFDGELSESFTIGSWSMQKREWTEIMSPMMKLEKNTRYSFTFWLNGGENDRGGDEVCQMHILYDNNKEQALIYKLNRNYIRPLKKINGWNLYEIVFMTEGNEFTQIKFVANGAYTTIMPAKSKEAYEHLEDVLDKFEDLRPQRHNIVWGDGWPVKVWYSTRELEWQHNLTKSAFAPGSEAEQCESLSDLDIIKNALDEIRDELEGHFSELRDELDEVKDELEEFKERS